MHLTIDRSANRLSINGVSVAGTRRWEAAVIATLVEGKHLSAQSACSSATLDAALAELGQVAPLTRKQWSLVWKSLERMFAEATASDEFRTRLQCPPRSVTVGPWWWAAESDDQVAIEGRLPFVRRSELPSLSKERTPKSEMEVCRLFLVCQSLVSQGQLDAASETLRDESAWHPASTGFQAIRLLRLTEVQLLMRNFRTARASLKAARLLLESAVPAQAYLGAHLLLLAHRIDYAENPTVAYSRILGSLAPAIRSPAKRPYVEIDGHVQGLTLNLAALCERRWVEQHATRSSPGELRNHAQNALDCWSAALFVFLAANQHEHVHNMCSNLGYFFQRMSDLGLEASPDMAIEWYALAQAWHNRFDLPDNTVWEYVFIGDFWLQREDVRQLLGGSPPRITWDGRHPSSLEFYEYSAQRAREIGEPRQMAHTAFNLWRFTREHGRAPLVRRARAELDAVLDQHAELRQILVAEGYGIP